MILFSSFSLLWIFWIFLFGDLRITGHGSFSFLLATLLEKSTNGLDTSILEYNSFSPGGSDGPDYSSRQQCNNQVHTW